MGKKVSFLPLPPPPSFIFWLSCHFSRGQNRKSPSSVFLCSEIKRKRLLRRLASCKCCQQRRLRSRWALFICRVLCHVNLLERTVFENICFPFFPYINFYLLLDKIGLARKSRVHESVTKRGLVFLCSGKNVASSVWKSTTVNHFTINHAV